MASPIAHARGVRRFVFRVDLATGVSTQVIASRAGEAPVRGTTSLPGWWKRSTSGRRADIEVVVQGAPTPARDPRGADPIRTLVVAADHQERLRLPCPDPTGDLVWYAIEGDVLVLAWRASNGRPDEGELSGPEHYWGVDLARGHVGWKRVALEKTERALPAGDGRLLVYGHDQFSALEASTGRVAWRLPRTDDTIDALPELCSLSAARWLVATTEIRAVDPSGHVAWTWPVGPRQRSLCRVAGQRVFVAWQNRALSGPQDGLVMALDVARGNVVWRSPFDGALSGLAVVGGGLALSTTTGIAKIDASDGRTVWKRDGVVSEVEPLPDGDWFLPGPCERVDGRTGAARWGLGESCVDVGERILLTVVVDPRSAQGSIVWLRQYSFADRKLHRQDVVQRYRDFFDTSRASIEGSRDGFATIESEWTVLD